MKKIFIVCLFVVNLFANDTLSKFLDQAKEYSIQGKNILIEQTLKNGINALVDQDKIDVKLFDIDDNTNAIKIMLFLEGEDKELTIDIKKFDWGVTGDEKYIVFENYDLKLDIPWMQYIINDMAKRDNGYIKVPYNGALFTLLYSIKPNIKTTYKYVKKKPFNIFKYNFNYSRNFIKIKRFVVGKQKVILDVWLKGSSENLTVEVDKYVLRTANGRKIIVLQDINFKQFTKPWIKSIIEKQNNEIHFDFTKKVYKLLGGKD